MFTESVYHATVKVRQPRRYSKRERAQAEARTRARIVAAVVALHEDVGPARTTVTAIAERAGVQRLTVYRHFPSERDLIMACSAQWNAEHQPPALSDVAAGPSRRRTRQLLLALYHYYRGGARMLANVLADSESVPVLREALEPFAGYLDAMVAELARAWPRSSARRRATLRHAVQFTTWRSLASITGSDAEAVALLLSWCDAARAEAGRHSPRLTQLANR
jgi:AcrR family transcriptional regulator